MKPQAQRELAEKLYVQDGWTYAQIANSIGATEKTVWEWGKESAGNWAHKRENFLKGKQAFHEELYVFCRKLMESLKDDILNNREPSQTRANLLKTMLSSIPKTKEYEEAVGAAAAAEHKTAAGRVTDDTLAKIEEQVFGIKRE